MNPTRWLCQWATINGSPLNILSMAHKIAVNRGDCLATRVSSVWCTAKLDRLREGEIDVGSLKVWKQTETHGVWFMHETTRELKDLLVIEHGGYIPWFKR